VGRLRRIAVCTAALVGALLLLPGAALGAVTCDVQSGGGLDIRISASFEIAQIERSGENIAVRNLFGPVQCIDFEEDPVTPTVGATPVILVSSEPGVAGTIFIVDDAAGFSSIPTFVNLRNGADSQLSVRVGDFSGHMLFGTSGVDTDPGSNPDLDITANNVPEMNGRGGFANPVNFDARGGGTTGGPLNGGIEFQGSSSGDVLNGADGADFLWAFAGNDVLSGHGGEDHIKPGAGADSVEGGAGVDLLDYDDLNAGVSVDLSLSGAQNTGAGGNDLLHAFENLRGTIHVDVLRGDSGPNRIEAIGGVDVIAGRGGIDEILAGVGDDEIDVRDGGPDTVDCGDGNDQVTADAPGVDTLTACETVERPAADAPAPDPAPAPSPAADQPVPPPPAAPTISSLRLDPVAFAARRRGPSARSAASSAQRRGTTVSFRVDAAASVAFRVVRRRCAKSTRRRSCNRFVPVPGNFTRAAAMGTNRFRFSGRIGGRVLKPGAYRLQATPSSGALVGPLAKAGFRIVP
jgi:hypothetical protein